MRSSFIDIGEFEIDNNFLNIYGENWWKIEYHTPNLANFRLFKRKKFKCSECGFSPTHAAIAKNLNVSFFKERQFLTIEHIIPLGFYKTSIFRNKWNFDCLCNKCNCLRGERFLKDRKSYIKEMIRKYNLFNEVSKLDKTILEVCGLC